MYARTRLFAGAQEADVAMAPPHAPAFSPQRLMQAIQSAGPDRLALPAAR